MRRIILYLVVGFLSLAIINVFQATVIVDQRDTIFQLMAPMPQVKLPPPPAPKGVEPPKRRQLDTPAPTEQNFV